MKKLIAKYLVEFIVIITGISLSFYMDKLNENNYRDNLKNQSLKRILKNFQQDSLDLNFNLVANKKAIYSTDWIVKRNKNLKLYSKDSIGFHLNRVINHNTFFVDNQEEYRGLQNSGLIELIENEKVVSALQQKYVLHGFFKDLEDSIRDKAEYLFEFSYKNLKYQSDSLDNQGYIIDRTYSGNKIIPSHLIEIMFEKKELHVFYTRMIKARLKADNNLAELIKNEISTK